MGRLTGRSALIGLTSALSVGRASLALAAAPIEQRFVVVLLRGAMDGLSAVVPYGDPASSGLRGAPVPLARAAMNDEAAGTRRSGFADLARAAGTLPALLDGPRMAALELGGWDTHLGEAVRLSGMLKRLDDDLSH